MIGADVASLSLSAEDQRAAHPFSRLLADLAWTDDQQRTRTDIPFVTAALSAAPSPSSSSQTSQAPPPSLPQATNLWIGTSASKTSMHRDHYENLFTVFRGRKTFLLYPPWENFFLVGSQEPQEVYKWARTTASASPSSPPGRWTLEPTDFPPTPWLPIDPSLPATHPRNAAEPLYALSRSQLPPIRVDVCAGQTLYLPSGWYHHVSQEEDAEELDAGEEGNTGRQGICLCVNWWYEGQVDETWAWSNFAATLAAKVS